jgi:hypothetical protein
MVLKDPLRPDYLNIQSTILNFLAKHSNPRAENEDVKSNQAPVSPKELLRCFLKHCLIKAKDALQNNPQRQDVPVKRSH